MKREEALNLLRKIEAFRQQPAMHKAEHDFTCRIIAAMVAEAGGFKSRNEWTACTESGELIKGETVKLYPVMVYLAESDQYETIGYDEEAPRVLLPGWRDYQKCGYNESYSLTPVAYSEASDRVYMMLPEGASVYADDAGCPVIDYDGFKQADVINQYDGSGCRPYIIDNDRRRAYLEVVEL